MNDMVVDAQDVLYSHMSPKQWTSIVHSWGHLSSQLAYWGPVREAWMFKFEDYFGYLMDLIHTRKKPIANIMKQNDAFKVNLISVAVVHMLRDPVTGLPLPGNALQEVPSPND